MQKVFDCKDFLHYIKGVMKKKMGRPVSDNPKAESVVLRVTVEEKAKLAEKAEKAGLGLSQYIRQTLLGKGSK